jgi:hypothetical protein
MSDPAFLPSQVLLDILPLPLVDTFGRVERELAAAMIVRTCQVKGDYWQEIWPKDVGLTLKADLENKIEPWHRLNQYPLFITPDMWDLVEKDYAKFHRQNYYEHPPITFTEKGLRCLRRYVVKPCPKCALPSRCLWWTDEIGFEAKGPNAGGWNVFNNTPKIIDDDDFNGRELVWKYCREIFICPQHDEFGLCELDKPPFFYKPDTYVDGPNGEKLFRL